MNILSFGISALFYAIVIALCAYLLVRGVTHLFVGLFLAGGLLHLLQALAYAVMSRLPGGFGAYTQYFFVLAIVGALGTILFAAAFISLTAFLLRRPNEAS